MTSMQRIWLILAQPIQISEKPSLFGINRVLLFNDSMKNMTFYKANRLILGHGVDIVDINDFKRLLSEPLKHFINRTFTESEMTSSRVGENQIHKLAGRFAVKEAILKTLGVGWGDGVAFTDVEIITLETGAPTVRLHRNLLAIESQRGIVSWLVSTSHTNSIALASVIACGEVA